MLITINQDKMSFIKLILKDTVEKTKISLFERFIDKLFKTKNDYKIDQVEYWYLEIKDGTGEVKREIGFNNLSEPIISFPSNENPYGFWADSPITLKVSEFEKIETIEFEAIWKNLENE